MARVGVELGTVERRSHTCSGASRPPVTSYPSILEKNPHADSRQPRKTLYRLQIQLLLLCWCRGVEQALGRETWWRGAVLFGRRNKEQLRGLRRWSCCSVEWSGKEDCLLGFDRWKKSGGAPTALLCRLENRRRD
jgi:hypothetical protein